MSSTVKTVLIVGGAVAAGYFIVRALTPSTVPRIPQASGSSSFALSQIPLLGNVLSGIFSASSAAQPVATPGIMTDAASIAAWNNISTSTLDSLRAQDIAMGVEGPF